MNSSLNLYYLSGWFIMSAVPPTLLCLWREPDVTNGALISIWPPHYALFTCLSLALYLFRQIQGFHKKAPSVTQFCCWEVKVSITFALQDFSNNLSMQKHGGRVGVGWGALLLGDIATPRRCRLGSGVLTAAQIPRDDRKKHEQKLQ